MLGLGVELDKFLVTLTNVVRFCRCAYGACAGFVVALVDRHWVKGCWTTTTMRTTTTTVKWLWHGWVREDTGNLGCELETVEAACTLNLDIPSVRQNHQSENLHGPI